MVIIRNLTHVKVLFVTYNALKRIEYNLFSVLKKDAVCNAHVNGNYPPKKRVFSYFHIYVSLYSLLLYSYYTFETPMWQWLHFSPINSQVHWEATDHFVSHWLHDKHMHCVYAQVFISKIRWTESSILRFHINVPWVGTHLLKWVWSHGHSSHQQIICFWCVDSLAFIHKYSIASWHPLTIKLRSS